MFVGPGVPSGLMYCPLLPSPRAKISFTTVSGSPEGRLNSISSCVSHFYTIFCYCNSSNSAMCSNTPDCYMILTYVSTRNWQK